MFFPYTTFVEVLFVGRGMFTASTNFFASLYLSFVSFRHKVELVVRYNFINEKKTGKKL